MVMMFVGGIELMLDIFLVIFLPLFIAVVRSQIFGNSSTLIPIFFLPKNSSYRIYACRVYPGASQYIANWLSGRTPDKRVAKVS